MTRCIVLEGTPHEHLRQELAAVDEFLELLIVRQRVFELRAFMTRSAQDCALLNSFLNNSSPQSEGRLPTQCAPIAGP